MIRKCMAVTAALALALGVPGAVRANFVVNGNFEQTTNTITNGKAPFSSVQPTGWSGGANLTFVATPGTADDPSKYLDVYGPFPATSPDGGNFILADGDPNFSGAFSQTINGLTPGEVYELFFYQAAGQQSGFTGSTTERWSVTFAGVTQSSSMFSLPEGGVGPWESQTMFFTANNTSEVLTFLAVGTPGGGPPISFLDGVSLNAVPEPSTFLLTGLGLVGLCAAKLRRRAKSADAAA